MQTTATNTTRLFFKLDDTTANRLPTTSPTISATCSIIILQQFASYRPRCEDK
uniref:Uncharacterized protein n=1 Tax=Arundo donax TaxID=35708 RepID=A0A0A9EKE8_ARUDO